MPPNTIKALARRFWDIKKKLVEAYRYSNERMPDDDLISLTFVTLYQEGYQKVDDLEEAALKRLMPSRNKESPSYAARTSKFDRWFRS
jgi:hypothetical protein